MVQYLSLTPVQPWGANFELGERGGGVVAYAVWASTVQATSLAPWAVVRQRSLPNINPSRLFLAVLAFLPFSAPDSPVRVILKNPSVLPTGCPHLQNISRSSKVQKFRSSEVQILQHGNMHHARGSQFSVGFWHVCFYCIPAIPRATPAGAAALLKAPAQMTDSMRLSWRERERERETGREGKRRRVVNL